MRTQHAKVLEDGQSATDDMGARFLALSEEAKAKRRATWKHRQKTEREDALTLLRRGLVPLAVADELRISDRRLARYIHYFENVGEIERLPPWITLYGPGREREQCPHCRKTL